MVLSSQRTIYGVDLEMAMMAGVNYKPVNNTTLNEKFNIDTNILLPEKTYPTIKYFAIGVGGNPVIDNVNNYTYSQHSPLDAALFEQIPFVMKTAANDLLPSERTKYRFRITENIGGITYISYYLKVIDRMELINGYYKVSTVAGYSKVSVFNSETTTMLNPVPMLKSNDSVTNKSAEYIIKVNKLKFSLSIEELADIENVKKIKRISDKNITEIAICTGYDYLKDGISVATNTQIAFHVGVDLRLNLHIANNKPVERSIELGGAEPMLI